MPRYLNFRFDVSALTDEEIGHLEMYVGVQAEGGNDGEYPAVPAPEVKLEEVSAPMSETVTRERPVEACGFTFLDSFDQPCSCTKERGHTGSHFDAQVTA